ncbi:MAG: hypothetical protein DHS20C18_54980 [Saprospiraceae bacterium]|nr:MAG: hypothetical protein DHS20C18_54980 [Saprospiraceae bacterium]
MVYSTGYSILPKDWDFRLQRPIMQTGRTDLFKIKRYLDDLATYCMDIYLAGNNVPVSVEVFKKQLDIKTEKATTDRVGEDDLNDQEKRTTFFEFIDQEIEGMVTSKMKVSSLKVFKRHTTILKEFAAEVFPDTGSFDYEDVDWNFRLKLIDWLASRNAQLAYGNKTLKTFRQFLERARKRKLHSNTDYQGTGWLVSPKKAVGHRVILTSQELDILASMQLPEHLSKVRDICLIGAGTGQRHSDFSRYTTDNSYRTINNVPILSVISQKTDTPAKIPLNIFPWLIPILEKHEYLTPKMSMQKFNKGIKELCKLAGFDVKVLRIEQYIGRKPVVKKYYAPKYEEVSSHICRRSFATNLYRMGYRLAQIMYMTGHSTESQLRKYIGIDSEQNAEEIAFSIMERKGRGLDSTNGNLRVVNG